MGWNPTRRRLFIGMSAATALFMTALQYRTSQVRTAPSAESRAALEGWPEVRPATDLVASAAPLEDTPPIRGAASSTGDPSEASTVAEYTAEKYRFLTEDLRYLDAVQVEELQRLLQARERLAAETNSATPASEPSQQALARTELRIRSLLHPADLATYEMLKESDLELFKLNEYAGGVSNVAPLSDADRESILMTKLAYKQRFRQLVADLRPERPDLSAAERDYAYQLSARALGDFQRDYLQEVRQYLVDDEQFALLSNYETSEFKTDLARLLE